jgi:uncharacterized protein (TIGR02466 family)
MKFIKDLPITHNGLFIYNLDIKTDYSKYYTSLKYNEKISQNLSVLKDLPEIEKEIKLACDHFINNILFMECKYLIYNSWFTKIKPNNYSGSHIHNNSWISGIYYPIYNQGFKIQFFNDLTNIFYTPVKQYGFYNSKSFTINPLKNQLILFFSNLRHEICVNESNLDRYSLAFNILPNEKFGEGDSALNFKLE